MSTTVLGFLLAPFAWRRKETEPKAIEPPVSAAPAVEGVGVQPVPAAPIRAEPSRPVARERRRAIATWLLCHQFVAWMRDNQCTGYWLVEEIDEYLAAYCDQNGYVIPHPYEARSYLATTPGVKKGRFRLAGWEFAEVRRRTGMERPTLYRISSSDVEAAFACQSDAVHPVPDGAALASDAARTVAGKRADTKPSRRKSSRHQPSERRAA